MYILFIYSFSTAHVTIMHLIARVCMTDIVLIALVFVINLVFVYLI